VATGASSGIGKAIVLSLAGHGTEVCLVVRRRRKLAQALGSRGHACPADLTTDEDIRGLSDRFQKGCGECEYFGALSAAPFSTARWRSFARRSRLDVPFERSRALPPDPDHASPSP